MRNDTGTHPPHLWFPKRTWHHKQPEEETLMPQRDELQELIQRQRAERESRDYSIKLSAARVAAAHLGKPVQVQDGGKWVSPEGEDDWSDEDYKRAGI